MSAALAVVRVRVLPLVPVTRPWANVCRTKTNDNKHIYKPQLTSSSVGLAPTTSECETFGGEPELLAAVHTSICSSRQSVSQLQLDHDITALPGVLINWHYHRHYHSLTLASFHTACMLEIELALASYMYMCGSRVEIIVSLLSNTPPARAVFMPL